MEPMVEFAPHVQRARQIIKSEHRNVQPVHPELAQSVREILAVHHVLEQEYPNAIQHHAKQVVVPQVMDTIHQTTAVTNALLGIIQEVVLADA